MIEGGNGLCIRADIGRYSCGAIIRMTPPLWWSAVPGVFRDSLRASGVSKPGRATLARDEWGVVWGDATRSAGRQLRQDPGRWPFWEMPTEMTRILEDRTRDLRGVMYFGVRDASGC